MPPQRPALGQQSGIVCFSAQDWWYHNHAHSDFQLMTRVARTHRVLFVNSIGMRMPLPGRSTQPLRRIARKLRSVARRLKTPRPDLPEFHVLTPLVLPFYGLAWARALNAALVQLQVRSALRRLRLADPVYLVTIPTAWEVVRRLKPRRVVYNRSDKHSAFAETPQAYIRSMEDALLRHTDGVLYVSSQLMAAEDPVVGDRGHFLDHGVDVEHFTRRLEEPADLRDIARPRIGFFGGIDDYVVNLDLIARVARELPDAQVVLVGDATCPLNELATLPNVHLLGYRPYAEIPAYGSAFDVALMPWLQNEWIEACNPIKLKEYLALGLPVVSTDFPEVRRYRDVIAVARDGDEFVALVRRALAGTPTGTPDSRRAHVLGDTWDRRTEELIGLLAPPTEATTCAVS